MQGSQKLVALELSWSERPFTLALVGMQSPAPQDPPRRSGTRDKENVAGDSTWVTMNF
jgi:hypothetical protein